MPPKKRPTKKPARTQPPGNKKGGEKLQKARLMGAASNALQIFNDPEHPANKRGVDYTDPYFNPLEQIYTEAAQSGLTFHEWAKQQRAAGREPIHEVLDKMSGDDAAEQYPVAVELIENLRDLDRMGTGDVRHKPGQRKTRLGEFEDVPSAPRPTGRPPEWPKPVPKPRDNPLIEDDAEELYRHGWFRDQAGDVGMSDLGEIKRKSRRR